MQREDWHHWMQALGNRVRRARLFLRLSQAQVANMAGVSQGAMSRLEHGKGLETPMSVVLRLHGAIAASLRQCDPALLDAELAWVLNFGNMLSGLPDEAADPGRPEAGRDELSQLFKSVRAMSSRERRLVVVVLRSLIETIAGQQESDPRQDAERRRQG